MPNNNKQKFDLDNRLEIIIKNENPVLLTDLTIALLSVSQQYERFIENEAGIATQLSSGLFVKEVRSGSIVVELMTQALPVLPLFWSGGSLNEWLNYAKSVMEWLNGRVAHRPKNLSKQDLKQWNNILEPIAKDSGSQINFAVNGNGNVIQQYFISSSEAKNAQTSIAAYADTLDETDKNLHKKVVMVWFQAKFDSQSDTGNKAIIEKISKNPIKVLFENNAIKKEMLLGDERYAKPWHELAYIVDVQVQTINNQPKVYTIVKYYEEETFDPEE